jgi:diguanylate cyclase (GGDEF)-like protein
MRNGTVKHKRKAPSDQRVQRLTERLQYLEGKVRELSALYEISRIVEGGDEPEAIFARALKVVCDVIPSEGCTLFLLTHDGEDLKPALSVGHYVNPLEAVNFTMGKGLSAWVAQEKKPVLLSRPRSFPVVRINAEGETPLLGTSYLRSFASVPLSLEGEVVGVLNLYHSQPGVFDTGVTRLLSIVASQVAATVKRVLVYQHLQRQATTDSLTGLLNHGYFHRRLREEVQRAKRYQSPLSVFLMDADNFKQINDRYGHHTGDTVLRLLASQLREQLRETDLIARYGGEEFIVLLPHTHLEPAQLTAERVRQAVHQMAVPYRRQRVRVSVSIGVAGFPQHGQTGDALIQKADEALYRAKGAGKDRVCVAQQVN